MIGTIRAAYPVYAPGTVPARSYTGLTQPVTTLLVRNFLLVTAGMADDLAAALVETLFTAQARLAQISQALTIDPRAAIGTQPVPLHPGAVRVYRDEKGS